VAEKFDTDSGVVTEQKPKKKLKRPRMYRVLVHNDDYTTREFVVDVLIGVFHHSETRATEIMLHIHYTGVGVAGVFTREVAETKIAIVERLAREREYPLRLTMEPDDDHEDET
jgi:ATP-dependent Clp protease adaptor protein ClpS